jgi:hypothetical protein
LPIGGWGVGQPRTFLNFNNKEYCQYGACDVVNTKSHILEEAETVQVVFQRSAP